MEVSEFGGVKIGLQKEVSKVLRFHFLYEAGFSYYVFKSDILIDMISDLVSEIKSQMHIGDKTSRSRFLLEPMFFQSQDQPFYLCHFFWAVPHQRQHRHPLHLPSSRLRWMLILFFVR